MGYTKQFTLCLTAEDKELLQRCIDKKWMPLMTGEKKTNEGNEDCALCQRYRTSLGCVGCPVKEWTGFNGCAKSPYTAFFLHTGECMSWQQNKDCKTCTALAASEVAFLRGLLALGQDAEDK